MVTLEQVMHQWTASPDPTIKVNLFRGSKRKWHIRFEEVYPEIYHYDPKSNALDNTVDWATETLKNWNTAHRTSWDMWRFDSKYDAEKFITLFNLVWAR
jgi:hypothetical protein